MCKDLRLTDQDEIRAMEVNEVVEAVDISAKALDVPGESGEGRDRAMVEGLEC